MHPLTQSHTDKQLLLLKRMGIDVWKLRHPAELNSAESPEATALEMPNPDSRALIDENNPSVSEPNHGQTNRLASGETQLEETLSVSSAYTGSNPTVDARDSGSSGSPSAERENGEIPASSIAESAESISISPQNPANTEDHAGKSEVVREQTWGPEVTLQPDANWCFVCAASQAETEPQIHSERTLFDAITFALDLQPSDFSLLWLPRSQTNSLHQDATDVSTTLSSLIEASQPKTIVIFGEQLAQLLIGTDKPIDVLRTEQYRYQSGVSQLIVTYGLAHLLANPLDKALTWKDLTKSV